MAKTSRKFKKGDTLKVGNIYGFDEEDNKFKVLCLHGKLAWVEWLDEGEVETILLDRETLRLLLIIK